MNAPGGTIDWDAAERRERRRDLLGLPGVAASFAGMVLLTGGIGLLTGGAAWAVVGALLVFLLLVSAASRVTPRLQARSAGGYGIQVALRRHVDPGPELRARADQQARCWAGMSVIGWAAPLGPIVFLLSGRWDGPVTAAAGTVLLVGAVTAWMLWWRRQVVAARRWLADPPGPPREAPPPTTAERWLTGVRGIAPVAGTALALALVVAAVVAMR